MIDENEEKIEAATSASSIASGDPKLTPREIQQRIRSGESVERVAHAAGTTLEYAERFAAPIFDELDHILQQALDTPVITADSDQGDDPHTFGEIIALRLSMFFNTEPNWSIWKDLTANRWIVQLKYLSDETEQDARWWYEPKRQYLSPLNPSAENLSSVSGNHPSRLKVFGQETLAENITRFDSAAFRPDLSQEDTMPHNEPIQYGRSSDAVITELYRKGPESNPSETRNETEDLLEQLDKNRGERTETQPFFSIAEYEEIDIPLDDVDTPEPAQQVETDVQPDVDEPKGQKNSTGSVGRRGRQQVPSWDEIIFGAKPEEF